MAVEIVVPALGESIVEATITRWMKQEGELVAAGEPVVELETDKVNLEVPAEEGGTLQTIKRGPGETVTVGDVIGLISQDGKRGREGEGEKTASDQSRSEEHTSELQSPDHLVCRLLLEKKKDSSTAVQHG